MSRSTAKRQGFARPLVAIAVAMATPSTAAVRVAVPPTVTLGEADRVAITRAHPGTIYTLSSRVVDENGQAWCSAAKYRADRAGKFDTRSLPLGGNYSEADPSGLFWAATPCAKTASRSEAHEDYRSALFQLFAGDRLLASAGQKIWLKPPDVEEEVIGELLGARLLRPTTPPRGLVLVVGGSEGGVAWARRLAALLAHQRLAALAIPYIRSPGLPDDLSEIPLERISEAARWLAERYPGLPLKALSYSRGAEMVLAAAATEPRISGVVAISPSSVIYQSATKGRREPRSSWTLRGKPLPFLRYLPDSGTIAGTDAVRLRLSALAAAPLTGPEHILIEKINGPVLLLSGDRDRVWPSSYMAGQLCARRTLLGDGDCRHMQFNDAGHMLFGPGWSPTTQSAKFGGGDPKALAVAQRSGWAATIAFLRPGDYRLPFPPRPRRLLIQGNNGRHGHSGANAYAFDFIMPVGSDVLAARGGTVVAAESRFRDGDHVPGHENFIFVRHPDGTFGRYYHLTFHGPLVSVGDTVRLGQLIAHSGDTGASAGPHLHFDVTRNCPDYGCPTIPVSFTNAGGSLFREGERYPEP